MDRRYTQPPTIPKPMKPKSKQQTTNEGGTLKTLSLSEHSGQKKWNETVIYLDRIQYAQEYPYEDYPGTCCINDMHYR